MVDFSFLNLIMLFLKFAFILRINYFIFFGKRQQLKELELYTNNM